MHDFLTRPLKKINNIMADYDIGFRERNLRHFSLKTMNNEFSFKVNDLVSTRTSSQYLLNLETDPEYFYVNNEVPNISRVIQKPADQDEYSQWLKTFIRHSTGVFPTIQRTGDQISRYLYSNELPDMIVNCLYPTVKFVADRAFESLSTVGADNQPIMCKEIGIVIHGYPFWNAEGKFQFFALQIDCAIPFDLDSIIREHRIIFYSKQPGIFVSSNLSSTLRSGQNMTSMIRSFERVKNQRYYDLCELDDYASVNTELDLNLYNTEKVYGIG